MHTNTYILSPSKEWRKTTVNSVTLNFPILLMMKPSNCWCVYHFISFQPELAIPNTEEIWIILLSTKDMIEINTCSIQLKLINKLNQKKKKKSSFQITLCYHFSIKQKLWLCHSHFMEPNKNRFFYVIQMQSSKHSNLTNFPRSKNGYYNQVFLRHRLIRYFNTI